VMPKRPTVDMIASVVTRSTVKSTPAACAACRA
jgi:hypothetical protein